MPKAKFDFIYKDLKSKIETNEYHPQELLPSENTMVTIYSCSRNTIRRAISKLAKEGYVQSMHGKGVRVIYDPHEDSGSTIHDFTTLKNYACKNLLSYNTQVMQFAEITADDRLSKKTGFPAGCDLYYIQRIRFLNDEPLILDVSLFLKSLLPGLTKEIASQSIYDYIENSLDMPIITTKRKITVESATEIDNEYLNLKQANCLAVTTSQTYNADGIMFEYTQSRQTPDSFCFQDTTTRKK